jgi:DNA repair protein RecN (Recombination protein N)
MLRQLFIQDLVIVHRLDLDLEPGMTALTGETGAGKSILIDALGLALGEKADVTLIRSGCERAEVTAVFDVTSALAGWLNDHDLLADSECILRRVVARNGRSRAFINGSPAPIGQLRELGAALVDIHGQHAHQSLLRKSAQRELLDNYGDHHATIDKVASAFAALCRVQGVLSELEQAAADRANRLDYLTFQVAELDELNLHEEEWQVLGEEQRRLAHAEQLRGETAALADLLFESELSVQPMLSNVSRRLAPLAELDEQLNEVKDLLESARIQVEEASTTLRDYADRIDLDPQRLAEIDERLARIHDLARKHRLEPPDLPARWQTLTEELTRLQHADESVAELQEQVEQHARAYRRVAAELTKRRNATARRLSTIVTEAMQGLAMPGGRFDVAVNTLAKDKAAPHGLDEVEFLVSANPGQSLAPLARVASGGELSRISLALQVAAADCGEVPTLIFDEVDVGIGGAVAEMVGRLLRELGKARQVLCVTHLPQVAAQSHHHLRVTKESTEESTETKLIVLNAHTRVEEIARMLGGLEVTKQTLAHAAEMIARTKIAEDA